MTPCPFNDCLHLRRRRRARRHGPADRAQGYGGAREGTHWALSTVAPEKSVVRDRPIIPWRCPPGGVTLIAGYVTTTRRSGLPPASGTGQAAGVEGTRPSRRYHSGVERAVRPPVTAAAATSAHADRARSRRDHCDSREHDAVVAPSPPESSHPVPLLQGRPAGSERLENFQALDVLYRRRRPCPPGGRTHMV